jgi:hypothetical protein
MPSHDNHDKSVTPLIEISLLRLAVLPSECGLYVVKVLQITLIVLLFSLHAYGQRADPEDRAHDLESKGLGLTETLLKFSVQQHLPIAIEYIDSDSMNRPIDVSVKNETIPQALASILSHGQGYTWTLQNGLIEIKNKHASKRAEAQLNTVIPLFDIPPGMVIHVTSAFLWTELQVALDPKRAQRGYCCGFLGSSSTVKPATLRNQTVRQILSYIVVNSRAQGWIVAGPPKCLGFTPYCGLWYVIEGESDGTSYETVLPKVRENL